AKSSHVRRHARPCSTWSRTVFPSASTWRRPRGPMLREATQTMGPSPSAAAPSDFADAMSALASGVAMVTGWVDRRPWGMTVNTFASVSADPPTILVSLRSDTRSARAIEQAGSFGISILGRHHRDAAAHGSRPGAAKFLEGFTDRGVE